MFVQMRGRRGQGDIWEQREVIRKLATDDKTKLCVVIESCGRYGIQDDTAVDLNLNFKLINLTERLMSVKEWPRDVAGEIMMSIAKEVFEMQGLVVVDCALRPFLVDALMKAFEEYYWKNIESDWRNKTHLVYVLPAE